MAKKTHIKVRLVPESKPDSPFFYYVKKPAGGEKAKEKLKLNPKNIAIPPILTMGSLWIFLLSALSKKLLCLANLLIRGTVE